MRGARRGLGGAGSGGRLTRGRGAHLAWPGTAKGNAPRGREDRSRELRGSATADGKCSGVVRAWREEGKKNRKPQDRAQTHRVKWGGGGGPRDVHRRRTKKHQKVYNTEREGSGSTDRSNQCKGHQTNPQARATG